MRKSYYDLYDNSASSTKRNYTKHREPGYYGNQYLTNVLNRQDANPSPWSIASKGMAGGLLGLRERAFNKQYQEQARANETLKTAHRQKAFQILNDGVDDENDIKELLALYNESGDEVYKNMASQFASMLKERRGGTDWIAQAKQYADSSGVGGMDDPYYKWLIDKSQKAFGYTPPPPVVEETPVASPKRGGFDFFNFFGPKPAMAGEEKRLPMVSDMSGGGKLSPRDHYNQLRAQGIPRERAMAMAGI